jgi:hypothetical protein
VYKFFHYDRIKEQASPRETQVDVLEESEKSFKIKVLDSSIDKHKKGDTMWVRKNNIVLPKAEIDYTKAFWNK